MLRTIMEPAVQIPVFEETDVLVVGGGPAGTAAAISAARGGAKVILLERYSFLGGLATGGQVLIVPNLNNGAGLAIGGIQQEWMDRLKKYPGGVLGPAPKDAGSTDEALMKKWGSVYATSWGGKVVYTTRIDPEMSKIVLDEMASEAGVTIYYHSWGTKAYLEDGKLKGVIFESKEGRMVILARLVIDATGEGDIFASAGAEYEDHFDPALRNSNMGEPFRLAGADYDRFDAYRAANRDECNQKMDYLKKEVAGFYLTTSLASRTDNIWVNNRIPARHSMKVRDLSAVESQIKHAIPKIIDFLRKEIPGYEDCYLMDIASVIGARHSRRLKALYQITMDDLKSGKTYDDAIAVTPAMHAFNAPGAEIPMSIPYRALIPEKLDGLIAAGRCLSADVAAHNWLNLIPHSVATGEAAGAATAMALKLGIELRDINVVELRKVLMNQGVNFL